MGPALETTSAGELKQGGEQRKKRRWTMNEKKSAKAAKKGSGSETGEEAAAAAVRVDSEATEDEDEVVFVKEVVHVQQGKMSKTCNEKRREWAAEHRDTLPERSSLNSKARRQIRRQIKAAGRDLDA